MKLDRLFVDLHPEQVRALLLALSRRLDGGFTAADPEEFVSRLADVESEDDVLIEPTVRFQGEDLPLVTASSSATFAIERS